MKRHGEDIQHYWTIDTIKETLERFDENKDGRICRAEFLNALSHMESKTPKAPAKKGKKKKPRRSWTWKKLPPVEVVPEDDKDSSLAVPERAAPAVDEPAPWEQAVVDLDGQRAEYWAKRENQETWEVPWNRKMPWGGDGETYLYGAMAHAKSLKKTPLVIDNTPRGVVDEHFEEAARAGRAVIWEARKLFEDIKLGDAREGGQVTWESGMKASRKLLVDAMKRGQVFYIALREKVTDFAGGKPGLTADDLVPISIFNAEIVASLDGFTEEAFQAHAGDLDHASHGLWESEHPWAKVLRPADLDSAGNFFVGFGFQVVVGSQMARSKWAKAMGTALPVGRLQPIFASDATAKHL